MSALRTFTPEQLLRQRAVSYGMGASLGLMERFIPKMQEDAWVDFKQVLEAPDRNHAALAYLTSVRSQFIDLLEKRPVLLDQLESGAYKCVEPTL